MRNKGVRVHTKTLLYFYEFFFWMDEDIKEVFSEYVAKSENYVMNLSEERMRREFAKLRALVISQEFLINKLIEVPEIKKVMESEETTKQLLKFYDEEIEKIE